jgi:hypothetical protein
MRRRTHVLLILIVALGAVIRLDNIRQPFVDNYTWRESGVAMMAENFAAHDWNIFYPEVNWVGPGPGYQGREFQTVSYVAAMLYGLVGQHEWVGRSVAVAFGLLGIVAVFGLTRRVWDEETGILAAALMAISAEGARIERSFIPDGAMVALVTTAVWMFVAYLQTLRTRYLMIALAVGTLGCLTKIPGMIVGLPMLYAVLAILRPAGGLDRTRIAVLSCAALSSGFVIAAYYLWARHIAHTYPPFHFAGEGNWIWDAGLVAWLREGYYLRVLVEHARWMWTTPGLVLSAVGLIWPIFGPRLDRRRPETSAKRAPWLFHWWVLAGGIYYAIGALELVENPSNFHLLTPAVAALGSSGAVHIARAIVSATGRRILAVPVLTALFALLTWTARHHDRMHGADDRAYRLGLALKDVTVEGDLVVALGQTIGCPTAIYYSGRRGWLFPPYGQINDWTMPPSPEDGVRMLEALRGRGASVFGVVGTWREQMWHDRSALREYLERTAEPLRNDETAIIYRLRPAPREARRHR